jgi:uncharacterized membrane protein
VFVVFGLMAAFGFGTGDFAGGLACRRSPTIAVLVRVQVVALAAAALLAVLLGGSPTARDLGLGCVIGVLNLGGLGALYHGLAVGRMGVVAPTAAVGAALIPVLWGLATEARPSAVALLGGAIAIAGGAAVAREHGDASEARAAPGFQWALAAAIAFGTGFILLSELDSGSGMWPVFAMRITALPVAAIACAWTGHPWRMRAIDARRAALAGILEAGATAILLVALRRGLAAEVAPVAGLAPGFTVVLAWLLLREPASTVQRAGVGMGLFGVVLLAGG